MSEDRPTYDPLGMTAKLDQMMAAMADMAAAVAAYRAALIAQGIHTNEAVVLVRDWHWASVTQGKGDPGKRP